MTYTITADQTYPQYGSPYLYFAGGTTVDKNVDYDTGGRIQPLGSGGIFPLDTSGLTVQGQLSIS